MKRKCIIILTVFFAFSSVVGFVQQSEARNFFETLFGGKKQDTPKPQPILKKKIKRTPKIITPQPKQKPKSANAKRILIVGDTVSNAIFDGLNQLYIDDPLFIVINQSRETTGLTNKSQYDLTNNLNKIIEKEKPDIIIVSIGSNENQPIKHLNQNVNISDPNWRQLYTQRVDALIYVLQQSKKPWIWVGQPAFKDGDLTVKISILNTIFKQQTEKSNGKFIDIWDGFVDDNGNFAFSGYDINGQTARLRTNDGLNFTQNGIQKLAFYLDTPIKAIFSLQNSSANNDLTTIAKSPVLTMLPRDIDRLAPINILDMARQNNGLLGDKPDILASKADEFKLSKITAPEGRADNYNIKQ